MLPLTTKQKAILEAAKRIALKGKYFSPLDLRQEAGISSQTANTYLKHFMLKGYVKRVSAGVYKLK